MAVGKLRGLSADRLANALGIAASSAAGLFAFVNGGADIKRLHAGHAAARRIAGGADWRSKASKDRRGCSKGRDGFFQAFARAEKARAFELPPPFGITDCYIKPYPCCRHVQPAIEAVIDLLAAEKIATDDVQRVDVETYRVAAEHAHAGWDDFASAQLSFHYLMALALHFRAIKLAHFEEPTRRDPSLVAAGRRKFTSPRRRRSTGSTRSNGRRG